MTTNDQTTTGDAPDPIRPDDIVAEGELNSEQVLERAVLYALEQGTEKLMQSGGFDPFLTIIKGEDLFIEDHPGETEEESYDSARRTILQMEHLCDAYAFCYDGFVELDDGPSDALIVEHASKGDESAQIIVCLYHVHGDHYHFDENLYQVGETETLFDDAAPLEGYEAEIEGLADGDETESSDDSPLDL